MHVPDPDGGLVGDEVGVEVLLEVGEGDVVLDGVGVGVLGAELGCGYTYRFTEEENPSGSPHRAGAKARRVYEPIVVVSVGTAKLPLTLV